MDGALNAERMTLVPATPEQLRATWESPDGTFPPGISPASIARLRAATAADPWVLGYLFIHRQLNAKIGSGGFKGEPDADGVVDPEDGQVWRFEKARPR